MEGIEGSHLDILRFSYNEDEIKKANEYYITFSSKNTMYEIPEEVKNSINEGLNSYKTIGKGCTNQELAMAKQLYEDTSINKIQVNKLDQYIQQVKNKKKSLGYDLIGGSIMENWLNDIKEERIGGILVNSLSNNELQEQIWSELSKYKYHDGEWEGRKYYVEEIYSDERIAIFFSFASFLASASSATVSKSMPVYFLMQSIIVMRSKGLPKSIWMPL